MKLQRAALIAAMAVLVTIGAGAVANAGSLKAYDSKLKMSGKFPAFHGKVTSSVKACEVNRKVRVYKKKRGHGEANDKKLGKDFTDNKGRWKVKIDPLSSSAYYAKVSQFKSSELGLRCRSDKSNVAVVD